MIDPLKHTTYTNVLYLSYDGMTDPLGQSQVLPYLVGLSEHGYRFHLISFEKQERFEKHREHIQQICDKAGITWHPLSYTKKPPLLSTIYDVRRMRQLAHKLHNRYNFSVVHCRSYISALVGQRMKQKFGIRFVFDMRGFWADERVDGKIWSLDNPVFKKVYTYFKRKEIEFLKEADHVISLTSNARNEILGWPRFREDQLRIEVIPCCVDLELFNPAAINSQERKDLKTRLGLIEEHYVLGYVGSIGTWYMLPEMLDYFKVVHEHKSEARFLIVTGEDANSIRQQATLKGIDPGLLIITSCLHKDVPLHISLFDASVFFIRPTFSKKASSPTKQGEIMAMGVPLVCNAGVGDTDLVVNEYKAGIVLNELNPESYANAAEIDYDRNETIRGSREFYGLEEGVRRYLKVYRIITDNPVS